MTHEAFHDTRTPRNKNDKLEQMKMAEAGLCYLTSDSEELARFMGTTGFDPDGLRDAVGSEELAIALMDYFAANEPALLAMCANSGIHVEAFMRLWHAQNRSM